MLTLDLFVSAIRDCNTFVIERTSRGYSVALENRDAHDRVTTHYAERRHSDLATAIEGAITKHVWKHAANTENMPAIALQEALDAITATLPRYHSITLSEWRKGAKQWAAVHFWEACRDCDTFHLFNVDTLYGDSALEALIEYAKGTNHA